MAVHVFGQVGFHHTLLGINRDGATALGSVVVATAVYDTATGPKALTPKARKQRSTGGAQHKRGDFSGAHLASAPCPFAWHQKFRICVSSIPPSHQESALAAPGAPVRQQRAPLAIVGDSQTGIFRRGPAFLFHCVQVCKRARNEAGGGPPARALQSLKEGRNM